MRRLVSIVLVFAASTVACGDALEGVGDLSRDFVYAGSSSSTTSTTQVQSQSLNLQAVTEVAWTNDGVDAGISLGPDLLIRRIWERGGETSEFIQSSRREIAAALPAVEFPRLVPSGVTHVTSQLVFDPQTASLDVSTAAAFGLWSGEPYTLPRTEAQLVVLRVGIYDFDDLVPGEIFSVRVSGGRELSWVKGDYIYQLFCRTGVSEESCFTIAESTTPLSILSIIGE
ncbi:MAG TPA: hypothetical protein VLD62_08360 [Acidimicrobiia bacterium]|nr:hypothetical protein [Acidimicrobiia bacterium]